MRVLSRLCLACVFAVLILGADAPIPIADHAGTLEDPDLVYNSETVAVTFDDIYTSAGIELARVDVNVLTDAGVAISTFSWTTGWTLDGTVLRIPIRAEAATLANGTYQIQARVWDTFGNVSVYSEPYFIVKQWRPIPSPGGCRTVP